ncbi:hypothetical protein AB4428_17950 [Vibrio lentus]
MKLWLIGLLALGLVGCAQTSSKSAAVISCSQSLMKEDERQAPYSFQQGFWACQEGGRDEVLTRRYVDSLILTGQFQGIKSGSSFPESVPSELVEQWRHWAKENL